MEYYFKRVWGIWGIDKIVFLNKGIFNVRFYIIENKVKFMEDGIKMFDKKFFIVKFQSVNLDIWKIDVESVLIWIRLFDLDIEFQGYISFMKIVGIIGKFIKVDRVNIEKGMLNFVKVLIEIFVK